MAYGTTGGDTTQDDIEIIRSFITTHSRVMVRL